MAADDSENSSLDVDDVQYKVNKTLSPSRTTTLGQDRTNNCRALQKKLELKVERAKRNYQQLQQHDAGENWDVCITQPKSTNLIPISRLQYPGCPEQNTLIEYKEVSTEIEDDLGLEEAKFFANKHKKAVKQEMSDTFSIQEMTIESDSESGSDTLELLTPTDAQYWERAISVLPCCGWKDL